MRTALKTSPLDRAVINIAEALRAHQAQFVPTPDPEGGNEDARDPRYFTTHAGAPIDLGNFSGVWFKPAVRLAFASPADQHLASTPFRRLRAAAITGWINDGMSSGEASEKAGNSSAVIEKHYRGVFAARAKPQTGSKTSAPDASAPVDSLNDVQLAQLSEQVMAERMSRLERDNANVRRLTPSS